MVDKTSCIVSQTALEMDPLSEWEGEPSGIKLDALSDQAKIAGPNGDKMKITVQLLSGKKYHLTVLPLMKVIAFKKEIAYYTDIPEDYQRLTIHGRTLGDSSNDLTLKEANVVHGNTLQLLMRVNGGYL